MFTADKVTGQSRIIAYSVEVPCRAFLVEASRQSAEKIPYPPGARKSLAALLRGAATIECSPCFYPCYPWSKKGKRDPSGNPNGPSPRRSGNGRPPEEKGYGHAGGIPSVSPVLPSLRGYPGKHPLSFIIPEGDASKSAAH